MEPLFLKNLPWPISLNKLFTQNRYTKQIIKHPAAQAYRKQLAMLAMLQMRKQNHCGFNSFVRCRINFYAPDARFRDIDNLEKILWDALQDGGVIKNDSHVINKQVFKYLPLQGTWLGAFDLILEDANCLYFSIEDYREDKV